MKQKKQNQARQTFENNKKQTSMPYNRKHQTEKPQLPLNKNTMMKVENRISGCRSDGHLKNYCQVKQSNQSNDKSSMSVAYLLEHIDNPHATFLPKQPEIKMLVALSKNQHNINEDQRLITFELPDVPCTVQDLLTAANILFSEKLCVAFGFDDVYGLIIMVIVLAENMLRSINCQEDGKVKVKQEYPDNVETPLHNSSPNDGDIAKSSDLPGSPSTENFNESMYVEGKRAICPKCDFGSFDFKCCMRCKKRLPDNVKLITIAEMQVKKELI